MKGYKAFNPDLTCRDMQYEVGKSYSIDEEPVLCKRGFHFCETIYDCSKFYSLWKTDNRVCEVVASGTIIQEDTKCVTNRMLIVRELSLREINRGLYSGCGYGYGYGDDYGYGYGDGNGNGNGDGYGDGYGNGYDYCYGDGEGYCNGDGNGNGDGYGYGKITKLVIFN